MYFETSDKIVEVEAKLNERIKILDSNMTRQINNLINENKLLKEDLSYYKKETFHLKMNLGIIRDYIKLPWYKKIFKKLSI
jgi:hypothetical protein